MQNENSVKPLVDILSEQLGESVVMSEDSYVYHAGLLPVNQNDVDVALLEQSRLEDLTVVNATKSSLMILCDKKQDYFQDIVLGYKNTPKQIERYEDKYKRAIANEWDEETNNLIIANYESYITNLRNFVDLLEYFRGITDDLIIAGDLDKANEVIALAEAFDETTTLADVDNLFVVAP